MFHFLSIKFDLSAGGSFSKCVSELTNSAKRALFSLKKKDFVKNPDISPYLQIQLLNSMVNHIINYGSAVWGIKRADHIEKF